LNESDQFQLRILSCYKMKKHDWDPDLYLQFNKERLQPAIDLVSKIDCVGPNKILDIGCGPGNSTQILAQKWPQAEITGIDNSPAMIKKASNDYPNQKWILLDAGKDNIEENFDIVFSNATIQWIPKHDLFFERFSKRINNHGVLAVQLPLYLDMPIARSIAEVAAQEKWQNTTKAVSTLFTIHNASFYYDQLSKYFGEVEIWKTDYHHIMDSHNAILEMIRSTGLRPYLERIVDEDEKLEFETLVLQKIRQDYPLQKNGKVLFPFERLFFTAKK
jgi:trans-aconitate 2-methyltransferase